LTRIGIFCWKRIRAVMCETASLWRFLDDWSRLHAQNLAQFVTQCKIRKDFFLCHGKGNFFCHGPKNFFVTPVFQWLWIKYELNLKFLSKIEIIPINYMEDTDIESSCCLERDCLAKK
jgi:hypothetical protein